MQISFKSKSINKVNPNLMCFFSIPIAEIFDTDSTITMALLKINQSNQFPAARPHWPSLAIMTHK